MNKINLFIFIFILLVSCTTDESKKRKRIYQIEDTTIKVKEEHRISDSSIIKEKVIVNDSLDSSLSLPSYYDYESVALLYLKQHIGIVYNEELYNKYIDSNRNKLMKLIEEYDQRKNIKIDSNKWN